MVTPLYTPFPDVTVVFEHESLPDVTVVFEHESFGAPPGAIGHPQHAKAGWRIILGSGFIYLLSPDGKVFRHENLLELVRAVPIPG